MRRSRHKLCLGCRQPFGGRADAKTCSAKCRKRFQRAKVIYLNSLIPDHVIYSNEAVSGGNSVRGRL